MYGRYGQRPYGVTLSPELIQALAEAGTAAAQVGVGVASSVRARKAAQNEAAQAAVLNAQQQAAMLRQQEASSYLTLQAQAAADQNKLLIVAAVGAVILIGGALYLRNKR